MSVMSSAARRLSRPALPAGLVVALWLLAAGCTRPTLASMKAPSAPGSRELAGDEHRAARDELAREALSRLGPGWSIAGSRYFLTDPATGWNAVDKLVGSDLEQRGGDRLPLENPDPGRDLVAVWKVGWLGPDHLAVSIRPEKTDGQLLVGYFALDRD